MKWYICNLYTGLVAYSYVYSAAVSYAILCHGVIVREDAGLSIVEKCRALWNAN